MARGARGNLDFPEILGFSFSVFFLKKEEDDSYLVVFVLDGWRRLFWAYWASAHWRRGTHSIKTGLGMQRQILQNLVCKILLVLLDVFGNGADLF